MLLCCIILTYTNFQKIYICAKELNVSIKSLAGQTMWYGMSTVLSKFINYLVVPITGVLTNNIQSDVASLFAAIGILNIVFTFGMETTFFRFARDHNPQKIFNIATSTIILIATPLIILLMFNRQSMADLVNIPKQPNVIFLALLIIFFDALASMPFAKLRNDQRPRKFAFIKILNVIINLTLIIFFIHACPWLKENGWASGLLQNFDLEKHALAYIFGANLAASFFTLLLMLAEFKGYKFRLHKTLWKQMLVFTLPLVVVGLGGMINELFDRLMLPKLLTGTLLENKVQAGIYVQNFKLAALIIIFIQAFRMGAEPFFMRHSKEENATLSYARIMNLFVIICCVGFLSVLLFYDVWKFYIRADIFPDREQGFKVVPILLLAKILYGVYYNLSVWFKLKNKTHIGAIITLIGAAITVIFNIVFIPKWGYEACAWASLACYGFMVLASYLIGQRYYPVPYNLIKIFVYLTVAIGIFLVQQQIVPFFKEDLAIRLIIGVIGVLLFVCFALVYDRKEFSALPVIGKYLK